MIILALALIAVAPLSTTVHATAAKPDRVAIRAAPHPGYGRLVFDWPEPIEFERMDAEGAVTVRFARPFAGDLSAVPERLGDYLRDIERTDDGRGVRLRLSAGVRARLFHFHPDLVVVDLERDRGTAADGPGVAIRTGEHDGFTRIVFDWPEPVGFRQHRDGRDLTLQFDREAEVDVVALGRRLQIWLEEATAVSDAQGTRVRLRLEPGLDARAFTIEGTRVVVDLLESAGGHAAAGTSDRTAAYVASTSLRTGASTPAQGDGPTAPERAQGAPGLPDAGPRAVARGETEPVPLDIDTTPREDGIALTFTWARPVPAAVFIRGGHLWTVFAAPVAAEADFPPALGAGVDAYLGPAEVVGLEGGTALQFPLSRTVDAAVARDGPAWQVILRDQTAKPRSVPLERFGEPPRLRLRTRDGGRLLHLIDPAVGDRLTVWPLLEPGRGQPRARRLVDLELIETAQGVVWRPLNDRLEAELTERGVEFDAPGGLFLSSPATSPAVAAETEGAGRASRARRVDGNAHVAAQPSEAPAGDLPRPPPDLAAEQASDHAAREAARDAPTPNEPSSSAQPSPAPVPGPPLGLADVAVGPGVNETARRAELLRALERAAPEDRGRARVELARFYLAQAQAPETLAVLRRGGEPDRTASATFKLAHQSLMGAAELLMGHLQQAETALETPALDHDREIALWRAVLAAARNDWPTAARELGRSEQTLETYPPALQVRLGVPAALIAVETGDTAGAFAILDRLADLGLQEADRARVGFIRGLAQARAGAIDQADRIWRHLEQSGHDETRIKAAYARVTMRLDAGLIDSPTALAELEAARPLWRGHPWELTMLDGLAHIRVEAGDRTGAIRAWQEALRRFPEAARRQQMAEATRATFRDALVSADGHALEPVHALAVYRDFPELMPKGGEGDRLRRRLAERLAALDLIEPAAELLSELIRDRPHGVASAETGADLAELWLRQPDAEASIDALEASRAPVELPEALSKRRQLVRARALVLLDRRQAALEVLGERDDPSAERLRLAVYWQEEAWSKVESSIETLLQHRADPDAPLGEDEQALVIRLAIAHVRLGDAQALARLRARFGPALRGERSEPSFLVATMTAQRGTTDTAAVLAAAEERISRFEDYLTDSTSNR